MRRTTISSRSAEQSRSSGSSSRAGRSRWRRALRVGGLLACVGAGIGAALPAPAAAAAAGTAGVAIEEAEPATREALWRQMREEKAKSVRPFTPSRIEVVATRVENDYLPRLFAAKSGFYPRFGSITQGGGFAVGPGYRRHNIFNQPRGDLFLSAAYSMRQYWTVDAHLTLPDIKQGRLFTDAYARYSEFPGQSFFGLGNNSSRQDRVFFGHNQATIGGLLGVRPARVVSFGGGAEYLMPEVGHGFGTGGIPSIETKFDDATAPGLATQPDFFRTFGFASLDYAEPGGSPKNGGRYKVTVSRYADRNTDRYAFTRTDVDLQQYLSVLNEKRVLALRSLLSVSDPDAGADVPFYFLPTLGGNNTLRGFRDFRFRDRNLLLFQAEYRWEVFTAMDAALFYDAGQVAERADQFTFARFKHDYGIGFRFGTNLGVFLRADLAFGGSEGVRPFLAFSHVF